MCINFSLIFLLITRYFKKFRKYLILTMNIDNQTNETNSTEDPTIEINTVVIGIEICLSIMTIILNLLNIVLISMSLSGKRTYSNIIFLLNTITDLIVGLISIPGDIVLGYMDWSWTYGAIVCVFYKTFDFANSNFSLMLLLVITIHRFLQLKDPFKQKEQMNRRRWLLIFMLFILNYGVWFAIWYIYFNKEENANVCYLKTFEIYFFAFNCVSTIGTFILIIIMNGLMIREFIIKKSKKMVRQNKKEDNAIYCILAITANLIMSWGLFLFLWPVVKICEYCVPDALYAFSFLLNYSFGVTNPIILLVFNQNYRSILFRKLNIYSARKQAKQTTSTMKSAKINKKT